MVACDVGQGDGLVLHAGPGSAVVVDTGPDPAAMDGCLRRLGVQRIPLVVLTHFHADHVDGLAGALHGRSVGAIEVTSLADPLSGAQQVRGGRGPGRECRSASAAYGETGRVGPLTWQVIAPSHQPSAGSESPPNDASLVLLVQTQGIRILMMGDEEDGSQAQLMRDTGGVRGRRPEGGPPRQCPPGPDLVRATGARLAVISVGARQRLRTPGSVAARAAARRRDAGGPHRPGRRRRGRRRRRPPGG